MKRTYVHIALLVFILIGAFLLLKHCSAPVITEDRPIKKEIQNLTVKKDSVHKEVKKQEGERKDLVKRFRATRSTIRPTPNNDSLLGPDLICSNPLHNLAITICDTIIIHDSIQIATMDYGQSLSDSIIDKYKELHTQDSVLIARQDKELKREIRRKKFWRTVAIIGTITTAGLTVR